MPTVANLLMTGPPDFRYTDGLTAFSPAPFFMAKYIPTLQATLETYQQWRVAQQQLSRAIKPDMARTVAFCGWMPPSTIAASLSLYARGYETAPADLAAAVKAGEVVNVRTVRGRRFLVERSMVPYAVAAVRDQMSRRRRPLWNNLGVDEAAKRRVEAEMLTFLGDGKHPVHAKLPRAWTEPFPPALQREAGNHATPAALLLAEMEESGLIHDQDGDYALFEKRFPDLVRPVDIDQAEARKKLTERFFAWGNVANAEDLAWWGGWTKRISELLLSSGELPLSNLVLSGSKASGLMVHSQFTDALHTLKPEREGPAYLVPARDPFFQHMPNFLGRISTPEQQGAIFKKDSSSPRALVIERGRAVATWNWSGTDIEWKAVVRIDPALRKRIQAAADRTKEWIQRELGDVSSEAASGDT